MLKRTGWFTLSLIVLLLLINLIVATAQPGSRYGLIAGNVNDGGFNQLAWAGMQIAAQQLGVQVTHVESTPTNAAENIAGLLNEGYEGVITVGFDLAETTAQASSANPTTPFISIDMPSQTSSNLGLLFATDEPAFLAGYMAASLSRTETVCTYGGTQNPPVLMLMVGFEHGVHYYNQQKGGAVKLLGWQTDAYQPLGGTGRFAGSYTDSLLGRTIAEEMFNQGCDIIFPIAGATGLGAAEAAQARGLRVIGVDADQAETVPQFSEVYITSVLKRIDVTIFEAISQIQEGRFEGGKNFIGTLDNGGVALAPFHSHADQISPDLQAEVTQLGEAISDGLIDTGWPIVKQSRNQRLTLEMLRNGLYPSPWTASGMVKLTNGEYRAPLGSTSDIVVQMSDITVFGDIDGDGFDDAAVVLVTSGGGSGTFYDLVAVMDRHSRPSPVATIPLGDRIQLNNLAIQREEMVVDMVTHAPNDPLCCPTQAVTERYGLDYSLVKR